MKKYTVSLSIVALFACLTIFSACKKYEEGPRVSLRSKSARVANTWKIDKVMVDGLDETLFFIEDLDVTYEFSKEGSYTTTVIDKAFGDISVDNGTWEFKSDKEQLELMSIGTGAEVWDIVRLKDKEMWLSMVDFGTKIEFHLSPK